MASNLRHRGAPGSPAPELGTTVETSTEPSTVAEQSGTPEITPVEGEGPTPVDVKEAPKAPKSRPRLPNPFDYIRPDILLVAGTVILCVYIMRLCTQDVPSHKKLFSREQLAYYTGEQKTPCYLAILGEVFDVTKGRKHYDKKSYNFFLAKDASRAFVTGNFKKDLSDDLSGFVPEQFASLVEWRGFYRKEYIFKGKVVGRFYNGDGKPTRALKKVEEQAKKAKTAEQENAELEAKFPSCNVRWTEAEGGTVWCDNGLYPRKIFHQRVGGKPTTRCACFEDVGWSDMRQVYPGCNAGASQCQVSPLPAAQSVTA